MVGASPNWVRPSYFVMKYLQRKGYRVIPVNPVAAGQTILGEPVVADLRDIEEPVDVVDIFRKPDAVPGIVDAAIAIGAKVVWMQLGIRNAAAGGNRRGGRPRRHPGPVHEDRIRPPLRGARLERHQRGRHHQPPPADPGMTEGTEAPDPSASTPTPATSRTRPAPRTTASRPVRSTRARRQNRSPAPATCPSSRRRRSCSRTPTTRPRCSTSRPSATSTAASPIPTVSALEARVASLEGGRGAVAVASGHAAQLVAFYTLLEPGDHFVASRFLYGGSLTQFSHTFPRLGWQGTMVDPRDEAAVRAAITPRTKLIFTESLSNPGGVVVDLEMLAGIAREHGIPLVVDNTMASPYLCRPFEWGADIVVHSMTKFLGGHGTSMGGIVVESGRFDWSGERQVPGSQPARSRVSRADLPRDVRRLRVHDEGTCRRAPRPGTGALADQRVQHPDRHRDAAAAHGAPRPERTGGGDLPGRAPGGRLGLVSGSALERVPAARPALPAARCRLRVHVRPGGRLSGGRPAGRGRQPLVAPRQRRRHPEPAHPPRVDHPSPAHRRAACRRGCRQRCHPDVRGHRDGRGPHRGPGPGAALG